MKLILKNDRPNITFNNDTVFIDNIACAKFKKNKVTWIFDSKNIAKFPKYSNTTCYTLNCEIKFTIYANPKDNSIRCLFSNKVLAYYDGIPHGALASYVSFMYYKRLNNMSSEKAAPHSKNNVKD